MPVNITITNAGRAAIVNAQNNGTDPVTITQVGLSSIAIVPAATAVALTGEFKRIATLSGAVVAADTIHLTMTDESADAYALRSFGLYLADGTLFAIYGQADPIINKTVASIGAISIDVIFADISAASLTFGNANFTNPPATTEVQGVVELSTLAEAQAGIDALRALTPATAKAAILGWLLAQDGSGSGLDADLLDGQDGSYYTNIAARLGFTPVNKAGDTMTGALALPGDPASALQAAPKQYIDALVTAAALLAKLVTVDGAGSGLDADLLDGQDGSFYTNIIARLGFTPVNKAGDTMTGGLVAPSLSLPSVHTAEKHIEFNRSGQTAYFYGNSAGIGLYDTQYGSVWGWGYGGAFTIQGATAWTANNDGSGSGLDADLLDGQDSGYYTNITARLGYTPLNSTAYTAADVKAKLLTVDGAGSGIDADLLDGQDGSFYTNITARLGFTPVRQGGGSGQLGNTVYIGWSGSRMKMQVDASDLGNVVFDSNISDVWRSSNDGAGSGMDADMVDGWHRDDIRAWGNLLNKPFNWSGQGGQPNWLWGSNDGVNYYVWNPSNFNVNYANGAGNADTVDGYHASAFERIVAESLVENGGYTVYGNGKKECWGYVDIPQDSYGTFNLPTAHTSWVIPVISAFTPGGVTSSSHNVDYNTIISASGAPTGIRFWNADDRVVRVWVQTKGV